MNDIFVWIKGNLPLSLNIYMSVCELVPWGKGVETVVL